MSNKTRIQNPIRSRVEGPAATLGELGSFFLPPNTPAPAYEPAVPSEVERQVHTLSGIHRPVDAPSGLERQEPNLSRGEKLESVRNGAHVKLSAIEARQLSFSYDNIQPILEDLTFILEAGTWTLIVGSNGSGKSTLAKLLVALELGDQGEILFFGQPLRTVEDLQAIRQQTALVLQNPDNQMVGATCESDVAFGPENMGLPAQEIRNRVDELLALVGLSDKAQVFPPNLSGGEKQRLAIAGALALKAKILVLDESTAMLDPQARVEILEEIARLKRDLGLTVVEVSHLSESMPYVDQVMVIDQKKIRFHGPVGDYLHAMSDPEAKDPVSISTLPLPCPWHIRLLPQMPSNGRPFLEIADGVEAGHVLACALSKDLDRLTLVHRHEKAVRSIEALRDKPACRAPQSSLMKAHHLSYTYPAGAGPSRKALKEIDFAFPAHGLTMILGASGSGKSTLAGLLNGLRTPTEGELEIGSWSWGEVRRLAKRKQKIALRQLRSQVGLVFQYPEHQLFAPTVAEDILFALRCQGVFGGREESKEALSLASHYLDLVGLDASFLDKNPFLLSGGEQRKVALAGVLAAEPRILVLDEVQAGLDPDGQRQLWAILSEWQSQGDRELVMITHDMDLAADRADHIMVLDQGTVSYEGDPADFFGQKDLVARVGLNLPAALIWAEAFTGALDLLNPCRNGEEVEVYCKAMMEIDQVEERGRTQGTGEDSGKGLAQDWTHGQERKD